MTKKMVTIDYIKAMMTVSTSALLARLDENEKKLETYYSDVEEMYKDVFDTIDIYGGFLNKIIVSESFDKKDLNPLVNWLTLYQTTKKTNVPKKDSTRLLKKDIGRIEKAKEIIKYEVYASAFRYKLVQKEETLNAYNRIKFIFDELNRIQNDLEEKEFKIITKSSYYNEKISKKKLIVIITELLQKYEIRGCSLNVKELVDNL